MTGGDQVIVGFALCVAPALIVCAALLVPELIIARARRRGTVIAEPISHVRILPKPEPPSLTDQARARIHELANPQGEDHAHE